MFEKQQNESPYDKSVSVTETVFRKRTLVFEIFVKTVTANCLKIQQWVYRRCYVIEGLKAGCGLQVKLS